MAEESKSERETASGAVFSTTVKPLKSFTLAELYHQKYYLQDDKLLMSEFLDSYNSIEEIVDSTAAARFNGYISGYGTAETLEAEINSYGLSDEGKQYLLKRVGD